MRRLPADVAGLCLYSPLLLSISGPGRYPGSRIIRVETKDKNNFWTAETAEFYGLKTLSNK